MTDNTQRAVRTGDGPDARAATLFSQYLDATRRRRFESKLIAAGAVVMLLGFAYASYRTLAQNFSGDRVRASVERVGGELVTEASPVLIDVAKQVAPVYRAEAENAVRELMPELTDRARTEFELCAQHLSEKAHTNLLNASAAPIEATLDRMSSQFPSLQDPGFREELMHEAEKLLHDEIDQVLASTQETYQPQSDRILAAFRKLEREAPADADTQELSTRFVHLWLMLIDAELMESTNGGKVGMANASGGVRGG
jgi:hypothetical protein